MFVERAKSSSECLSCDLAGANFTDASMTEANLVGADLTKAILVRVTRTPRRMMLSRWMPVRRSVARMLHPSVRAAMAAICLSKERIFMGPIHGVSGKAQARLEIQQ